MRSIKNITVVVVLSLIMSFCGSDDSGSEILPPNIEHNINSFSFKELPALSLKVDNSGAKITAAIPYNLDQLDILKLQLTPVFTISSGASLKVDDKAITSNSSKIKLSEDDQVFTKNITVTTANGDSKNYQVEITMAKNTEDSINSFSFKELPALSLKVDNSGAKITAAIPYNLDQLDILRLQLTPVFTISSGASLKVDDKPITSNSSKIKLKHKIDHGNQIFNFTKIITIVASGGSTKKYDLKINMAFQVFAKVERVNFSGSWYLLGLPGGNVKENLPMVVVLHGDEGSPNNVARYWENVLNNGREFIMVAPECPRSICLKTVGSQSANTWSNGGHIGSSKQGQWLKDLVEDVAKKHKVDSSRIYGVGYSGGAIFLGFQGFKMFQDVFAGIQWFCGGVNQTEAEVYQAPSRLECKVPGRIIISQSGDFDYLITAANRIIEILKNNGHKYESLDSDCNGHCCNASNYTENALDWFLSLPPKCGGK